MTPSAPPAPRRLAEGWILAAAGAGSLLPYVLYHAMFARLFWFGDEFDLIDQFSRMGFWKWVWLAFAENFVPVFKVLWGGAALAFGGSYGAMIALLWLTHALNVTLLGRLLRAGGLGWVGVLCCQIVFGLAPTNLETLGWSVQWSAVLSLLFMLAALDAFFRRPGVGRPVVHSLGSALTFSRGVLTGPLVALASLLTGRREGRWGRVVLYLAPAVVVAALIVLLAEGNHQHMRGHGAAALVYGLWYFCLNPAYDLLGIASWGWRTTLLLGALKVSLLTWALRRSGGRLRALLVVLLVFDLGNAMLLGVGRFNTGLLTVGSSRYQYASLAATLPFVGFGLEYWVGRLRFPPAGRRLVAGAALAALAAVLIRSWSVDLDRFTTWRGTDSRRILFVEAAPDPHGVPGIPFMPMDRAKQLIAQYHLH